MAPAPDEWYGNGAVQSSSGSPEAVPVLAPSKKFADEEEDSDVRDAWDESSSEEESEEEDVKAKPVAAAKPKSKAERIAELQKLRAREKELAAEGQEELSEMEIRKRGEEQARLSDLGLAGDLLNDVGFYTNRALPVVVPQSDDPMSAINLSALPLFNPKTKTQFTELRETLAPLLVNNSNAPQYAIFLQEFTKAIAKNLSSEQIKKVASGLTTLSNEKMKEEKAAEKGGKKTKAAKTKTSLVATRDVSFKADTAAYVDDFGDDDFM